MVGVFCKQICFLIKFKLCKLAHNVLNSQLRPVNLVTLKAVKAGQFLLVHHFLEKVIERESQFHCINFAYHYNNELNNLLENQCALRCDSFSLSD